MPLTGDEAYYWAWSRHLAFGYLDHPPMVAWLIAATSWLGHSSLAVRLPFIVCQALAALAVGRTALVLSANPLAGTAATIAFVLIPQPRSMLGEARPDYPYELFWSLSLLLVARATQRPTLRDFILLGAAFGGAILSRSFGWAVVLGIMAYALAPQHRVLWKKGLRLSLAIAVALYVPFIMWNAAHGWINLAFTVLGRNQVHGVSLGTVLQFSTLRTVIFAALIWLVATWVAIRPGYALLAWTALPLTTFLALSSPIYPLESNYLLGPFTSLSVGIGIAYASLPLVWKRLSASIWLAAAGYTMAVVAFWALPETAQAAVLRASHNTLKGPLYSEVFRYKPLSNDIRSLLQTGPALVVAESFETASELVYYGVDAHLAGTTLQSIQWRMWSGESRAGERALFVTSLPLAQIEGFSDLAARACAAVDPGPAFHYTFAGTSAGTFYTAWCRERSAQAADILIGRVH